MVVGIVSIAKDLGHPSDVLLASLCGHGHSISRFRFSWLRTKNTRCRGLIHAKRGERGHFTSLSLDYAKLKLVGQTKFERDRADLVRMMGELIPRYKGVAKKEMARRTGLSVPTVRKYLKMLEV